MPQRISIPDNSATLQRAERTLQTVFGYTEFRPPQAEVVARTLAGGHSLVILPTGGGKSICFQVPALMMAEQAAYQADASTSTPDVPTDSKPPLTLVLSPLISLMKDQVDRLAMRSVAATYINSSLDRSERLTRYAEIASGQYQLLYVTPERFRKSEFLEVIQQRRICLLAIDEAHCISQWGHDFRPDYSNVGQLRRLLGEPTTICLTATATPDVQQDILRQLGLPGFSDRLDEVRLFHLGIERPNLSLDVQEVWGNDEKLEWITRTIAQWQDRAEASASSIVYFTLIKTLEEFSQRLQQLGIAHACYHGDLQRQERRRIQDAFMKGQEQLVLATNAFGMGIDKEDIRLVIHADVPGSMEAYYQEIGRAGRDGLPSQCLLLYDQHDLLTQMEFVKWSNPDADFYHRAYQLMVERSDAVRSFGVEWLQQQLCDRQRHDRRLDTVLAMFTRYGLISDEHDLSNIQIVQPLPALLADPAMRHAKLQRDQQRLYALVQYVQADDRRQFLRDYFGAQSVQSSVKRHATEGDLLA